MAAAISLFTTPIITALIIPEEFGKAAMFTLVYSLLLQFFLLGIDQSYVRFFYTKNDEEYKSDLLLNSLYSCFLAAFVGIFLILVFRRTLSEQILGEYSFQIVLILIISLLVGLFERFTSLLLRMQQKASEFSLLKLIMAAITFAGTYFYAVLVKADFYSIVYGYLAALFVCAVVGFALGFSVWKKKIRVNPGLIKEITLYGLPFVPTFIASWLFEGVDKIMLRHFSNYKELGLFSASFKFVAILSILQLAFSTFWIPVSMELYEKNSRDAAIKFSKAFSFVSTFLFIGAIGIIAFKDVIMLLFDNKYYETANIMPFLLFIPVMFTLSEITVGGINYSKKTYWHFVIAVIAAVFNILLNYFLIPIYGSKGAAISTGVSYIVFFLLRTVISNKYFPIKIDYKKVIVSLFVLFLVASLNTFFSIKYEFMINAIAMLVLITLYRQELKIALQKCKKNQ
jgi:O-antigen/teichoic acid export membrane protein